MNKPVMHIFRNTPFGRETLLQTAYLCRRMQLPLAVYLPEFKRFLMYFDPEVVQVDLDSSYLTDPATARDHISEILAFHQVEHTLVVPKGKTASDLPDLPIHFSLMTCPRSMSEDTRKIALGVIGSKVRRIVQSAHFPIFLPAPVFKPWTRLSVFYGGSDNAAGALRLALEINRRCNAPLQIFSQGDRIELKIQLIRQGFAETQIEAFDWQFLGDGDISSQLFSIPHDGLVMLGAYGKGSMRKLLFGSTMEKVQSGLPNSLMVVGPKCSWVKAVS
ncbi:universal stress protein [Geopsychrobacter electrodiphilus]|uniref:universal stress protein n=1 Tax=Geopsychrobacter electrodiphilus TaxID=225196 RepID=UPI0003696859|nr:universal stress protein [Geopsychrobacter electrodiphilus]